MCHCDYRKWLCGSVQILYESSSVLSQKTMLLLCDQAVISGNLEILQLTWRQNFKRSKKYSLLNTAVKNRHFDMLKWLHGKGCPCDENTSVAAVAYKHIEIFKWLHEIGCECCVIGCQYCGE